MAVVVVNTQVGGKAVELILPSILMNGDETPGSSQAQGGEICPDIVLLLSI